jgi:hypothetical protein
VADPEHTIDVWILFTAYHIDLRGLNNVPLRFLKNTVWRDHQGGLGYYAESTLAPGATIPVEFNYNHLCWVELRWRANENQWQAFRKAPEDLGLQIPIAELTEQEVIQILGEDSSDNSPNIVFHDTPPEQNTPVTTPLHNSSMSEIPESI